MDEPLQFFIAQIVTAAVHIHNLHKPSVSHERSRASRRGEIEGLANATDDHAESSSLRLAMLPLKLLEPRLQVHTLFLYLERRSLVISAARSSSVRRTSRSSISIALAE